MEKGQELDESKPDRGDSGVEKTKSTETANGNSGEEVVAANPADQATEINGQWINTSNFPQQGMMNGMDFGVNGFAAGFGAMGWNASAGFDPMMQNSYANGGWGAFPNMMGTLPRAYDNR